MAIGRGEPLVYDPEFTGPKPKSRRKNRDSFFSAIFFAFWLGMAVVAIRGFEEGRPSRLKFPIDAQGNMCGTNNDIPSRDHKQLIVHYDNSDRPVLFFPDPTRVRGLNSSFCIASCADIRVGATLTSANYTQEDWDDYVENEEVQEVDQPPAQLAVVVQAPPGESEYESEEVFNYCLPLNWAGSRVDDKISMDNETVSRLFGDVRESWGIVLGSAFVSLGTGYAWLLGTHYYPMVMIYATGVVAAGGFVVLGTLFELKGIDLIDESSRLGVSSMEANGGALEGLGSFLLMWGLLLMVLLVSRFRGYRVGAEMLKHGGMIMRRVPRLLWLPAWVWVLTVLFFIYWVFVFMYLASSGQVQKVQAFDERILTIEKSLKNMIVYHFFGMLWTTGVIASVSHCTVAGAVSSWYFTFNKKHASHRTTRKALGRTTRFHVGTIAFGVLVLSVTRPFRHITHTIGKLGRSQNRFIQTVCCCAVCCNNCFRRFLTFISKHAYVQMAIYGYGFCESSRLAYQILERNKSWVHRLRGAADFYIFCAKMAIVAVSSLFAFATTMDNKQLSSPLFVTLLVMIFSYSVGSAFMGVYEFCIATFLQCFCTDLERNDGSRDRPYYMSKEWKKFMQKHREEGVGSELDDLAPEVVDYEDGGTPLPGEFEGDEFTTLRGHASVRPAPAATPKKSVSLAGLHAL